MRRPDVLQSARAVSTTRTVRRGGAVALLALSERLLMPATAWFLLERTLREKLVVVFGLGAVFTLRTFVQHASRGRTEAELFHRVVAALLNGDVLRPNVLEDRDARSELGLAVFQSAQAVSQELPLLAADLVAATILGIVVIATQPTRLVILAACTTLAAVGALAWSRRSVQHAVSAATTAQVRLYDAFIDALEGRLEIVASGRRDEQAREAGERSRLWARASAGVATASVLSGRLPLLGVGALVATSLLANARWRGSLAMTLTDLALFASVTPAFAGVAQGIHALARSAPRLATIADVLRGPRPSRGAGRRVPRLPATVEFRSVSFRYDAAKTSPDAVHDVSFAFGGGSVLALAGANGSGKSTCLRLLLALAVPTAGGIRVGGVDLGDLDVDAWRASAAFLPQRPYLPARSSVRSCVHFLAPGASDDRIGRALERVGVLPSLERAAPRGSHALDLCVDTLSVGQRQRVALARMLCRDASLFVLDEPDANLDRAGVALVASLVRELAKDAMVILAAHTEELLDVASDVVFLEEGRVVPGEPRRARC